MKVTFVEYGDSLASSRLRAKIPQKELEKLGIGRGNDVLIYGKHFVKLEDIRGFSKIVFDVCDDHLSGTLRDYYLRHCENADYLTCNSEYMKQRLLEETGKVASVIPEPYEGEELKPSISPVLFWFGHQSNLKDLARLELDYPVHVLTNAPGFTQWTPENMKSLMGLSSIVIIPTGKSMAKSENRMVEAIRGGHYVCAEPLPSYEPFSQFFELGDIPRHVEQALASPEESVKRILAAQDYIRDRYSPASIGKQWMEVLCSLPTQN